MYPSSIAVADVSLCTCSCSIKSRLIRSLSMAGNAGLKSPPQCLTGFGRAAVCLRAMSLSQISSRMSSGPTQCAEALTIYRCDHIAVIHVIAILLVLSLPVHCMARSKSAQSPLCFGFSNLIGLKCVLNSLAFQRHHCLLASVVLPDLTQTRRGRVQHDLSSGRQQSGSGRAGW